MEPREVEDDDSARRLEEGGDGGGGGGEGCRPRKHRRNGQRNPWCNARTILGVFLIMLCLALLGLSIKMSVVYDEAPLIHVSVAFVGFTVST